MLKRTVQISVLALVIMLASSPAFAKQGLRLGGGLGLDSPAFTGDIIDEAEPQAGLALGLDLGYGFTDALSLNLRFIWDMGAVDSDFIDDAAYVWYEYALDIRYAFMTSGKLNPFVMLGVGGSQLAMAGTVTVLGEDIDVALATAAGVGVDLGGGFNYFLNDNVSLGLLAYYHLVNYSDAELTGSANGVSVSTTIDEETGGGIVNLLFTINYTFGK